MYKIVKLALGTAPTVLAACMTQMDLLDTWARQCSPVRGKLDLSKLNVTGKDTVLQTRRTGFAWSSVLGTTVATFTTEKVLKPYQVQDEQGRSIDIREWSSAIQAWPRASQPVGAYPAGQYGCPVDGSKTNYRKLHDPAMYKANLRSTEPPDDELVEGLPLGHRNRNNKKKSLVCAPAQGRTPNKSWKRQSKNRKQWGKHKPAPEYGILPDIITEEELETVDPIQEFRRRHTLPTLFNPFAPDQLAG